MAASLFLVKGQSQKPEVPAASSADQALEAAYLALSCVTDSCARKLWLLHVLAEKFGVPVVADPIALAREVVGAAILASRATKVYRACVRCRRNLTESGTVCEQCVADYRAQFVAESENPGQRIQFADVPEGA